ncbi:MAG: RNA polymerase sigma factor [Ignavibacteria bacterium]|nr:RNA polymerase sigma factor [Ignavibacteria bacterium]
MKTTSYPLSAPIHEEAELIERALSGDREGLSLLLKRHQTFIFNVALKMINNVEDAEDVTQEVLIKIITNLARYDPQKAKFTTWLYKIVFNHILNIKKQKYEYLVADFEQFFEAIESSPVQDLSEEEEREMKLQIEESKVACMQGMLMCLSREQRLIYIIGSIFEIDHILGSEILNITPDTFRQRLSRSKKDLHSWMHNRCGLVNTSNSCRCPKKTKGFIERGWVDEKAQKWHGNYSQRIKEYSESHLNEALLTIDDLYARLYQGHPYKIPKQRAEVVESILHDKRLQEMFGTK